MGKLIDSITQRLKYFPEEAGFSHRQLRKSASHADWRMWWASEQVRDVVRSRLDEAIVRASAWAAQNGWAEERLWRNLYAVADPENAFAYRCLFSYASLSGSDLIEASAIRNMPPQRSDPPWFAALYRVAVQAKPARPRDIDVLAPRQRVARLKALEAKLGKQLEKTDDRRDYLYSLLRQTAKLYDNGPTEDWLERVTHYLEARHLRVLLKLNDVLTLSAPVARALLGDLERIRPYLLPCEHRRLDLYIRVARQEDKLPCLLTPSDVLAAVSAWCLDDAPVLLSLWFWWGDQITEEQLRKAILRARRNWDHSTGRAWQFSRNSQTQEVQIFQRMREAYPDQLRRKRQTVELRALRLMLSDRDACIALLHRETRAGLEEVVPLLDLNQLLLLFSNSPRGRELLLYCRLLRVESFNDAVRRELHIIANAKDCESDKGDVLALLEGLLRVTSSKVLEDSKLHRILAKGSWTVKGHGRRLEVIGKCHANAPGRKALRHAVATGVRAGIFGFDPWDDKSKQIQANLLEYLGDVVIDTAALTLTEQEFELLCRGPWRKRLLRRFSSSEVLEKLPWWPAQLRRIRQRNDRVPEHITALAKNNSVLKALLRSHPKYFLHPALQRLPLTHCMPYILGKAAATPAANSTELGSRRLQMIAWVRRTYRRRPRVAAALEVACYLGPRYARVLRSLIVDFPSIDDCCEGYALSGHYHTYNLPKKSGGNRQITVPSHALRYLQRQLLDVGFAPLDNSPFAYGFRRGRSIVDNAAAHAGAEIVVNVDIHAFFPSVSYAQIRRVCKQLFGGQLSPLAQMLVAEICSYQGALPTGAPTSPAIGNIVLARADRAIGTVCERRQITYTRYADDLSFSGSGAVTYVIPFVVQVLDELGLSLDTKKTNIFRRGRRQVVTGLVVNERPNMVRPLRRRLRAAVHHRLNGKTPFWHGKPMSDSELLGRIAFLGMTQPDEAEHMRSAVLKLRTNQ